MSNDEWFTLEELAGRIAQLHWVEQQVAELLDRWSRIETSPPVAIALATASRHHAWHAEVLSTCVPTSAALAEVSAPRAPTDGWARAIDQLLGLDDPERTAARLLVVVRELDPWLDRETGALLDLARPIADAHLVRWLRFIAIDHHDDGQRLAELLGSAESASISLADRAVLNRIDLRT